MMSSKPTPRFMDSVSHCNLPRLERTVGHTTLSAGLPKSGDLPRYPDEPVNYSGTYFTYCLRGPEGTDLPPHWSPPGTCLQRSPVVHPLGAGQQLTNQIAHRPENMAHCVESSPPLATRDLVANRKPVYYDSIPEKQDPSVRRIHGPAAVRKLSVGGASISPPRDIPVGLAIPKPIYGHNPCCTEHGCTSGPCYGVERSAPRVHPNAYDEEWMLQYGPLSLLQRKEREALLQQGLLQLEQSAVRFPLRETRPEGYHVMRPAGPMRFPSFVEQNYSTFPYTSPARSPLSPSSDLFHRLQFPSKVYHGLPPPPPCTYEDMQQMAFTNPGIPPKMYPDHSPPIPRYMQLPQRPVFYYPQGNVEIENGVPYKGTGRKVAVDSPPTASNQVTSNHPRPCLEPQPTLSNFSAPCPTSPMNPLFPSNCDLSPFQVYRTHAGLAGQKRTFAEGPGTSLLVRHVERPVDYSAQRAWVTSPPKELCRLSPGAFHPMQQPLSDYRSSDHMSVGKCKILANHRSEDKQANPKEAVPLCGLDRRLEGPGPVGVNGADKPTATKSPNLGQIDDDLYEVEAPSKWQERKGSDQRLIDRQHSPPSPPMPVINKVFSLAPYKAYLQASGMLPLQNRLQNIEKHCNPKDLKLDVHSHERDSQQGLKETTHKVIPENCSQPSPEAGLVPMLESHKIKTEKVTPEDKDCSIKSDEIGCEEGCEGLKETVVKEEETDEVTSSSDSVLDLRMKKGEFNVSASEIQTSTDFLNSTDYKVDTSNGCGVVGALALNHNGKHSALATPPLKAATPALAPPETKVFLQHIPPQCVKQSAFMIVVPDVLRSLPSRAPEVPQPAPEPKPPANANRQARHRFMEMHQALFRLISASVSQTPEQELRAWLANLEPQEAASLSAKAPRISNLLGAAAREAWLRCRDTVAGLALVISQLEDYAASQQCPFPHVIRTGTLFIPMLVVKECLFPQISGALIDRVLQEHHVELRPTTLSEERHLMQLQRRACSSKLRRLLSLKHLPDIYPDVLSLFYHACVSKHLDSTSPAGAQKTAQV
ncbi:hypothetical protein AAFF_G00284640 [Aldrovandia affinis]|uniref:Uncharacterized protein n=1 Tax=Aldrovandia affinis TaxID=143900 RepID=A0AAD7X1R0_9TELE|nr:hypothetical protein AAFF_G00284640 [Aldrovandia affinis]